MGFSTEEQFLDSVIITANELKRLANTVDLSEFINDIKTCDTILNNVLDEVE